MKTVLRGLMTRVLGLLALAAGSSPVWSAEPTSIRVGVFANPPKLVLDQQLEISGIYGDLLRAIAREEGWHLEPVACHWAQCLDWLQQGQLDLLPDVAHTAERESRFDFHTEPVLHSWSQVYAPSGHLLRSPLDLDGLNIAVLADSAQLHYLQDLAAGFDMMPQFKAVASEQEAFAETRDGQAEAAVVDQLFGDFYAPAYHLQGSSIMFQPSRLYFAAPRGQHADLLARIDHWLAQWQADKHSIYYDTLRHWGGRASRTQLPTWLVMGFAASVLVLSMLAGFVLLLRRQISSRTQALATSEARLQGVLASVEACIYNKDVELRYTYINPFLCQTLERSEAEVLGRRDADFFSTEEASRIHDYDRQVLATGERSVQEETLHLPGQSEPRTFLSVRVPLKRDDGSIWGLCGVSTDITEQRRQLEQIHQLAWYDSLTRLPNRRLLLERLERAVALAQQEHRDGAVLFIDLDHFRDLNDALGHAAGDELLRQVAERLTQRMTERFTLARFGGDEFVLLLEGLEASREQAVVEVEQVAQTVLERLQEPFALQAHWHRGDASVGISLFSDRQAEAEGLIRNAELAMTDAKAGGSGCFRFFDPSMQAQVQRRAELEAGIRQGLAEGEFELWYQPQYDREQHLLGLEALVRWRHPERGLVSPGEFIPVAESTGLIVPLGDQLLEQACRQLVAWQGHPVLGGVKVAVNISARQIQMPEFVARVAEVLQRTGAAAGNLELELTESMLVQDVEQTIDKMLCLRALGVNFALDDFGTGYSSLIFLKQLPLDKLKIDQGFVRDLLTDANDAAIVRTIVALGQSLDLAVLAEGVETRAHCDALAAMGCYEYQGYCFSRPLPVADLERHLAGPTQTSYPAR